MSDLTERLFPNATTMAERHQVYEQAATAWDVFVLDFDLPDMTGYELAGKLRELHGRAVAPVFVALTGDGPKHDRDMSRAAGFQHPLVKPADTHKLLQIIG